MQKVKGNARRRGSGAVRASICGVGIMKSAAIFRCSGLARLQWFAGTENLLDNYVERKKLCRRAGGHRDPAALLSRD